MLMFRFWGSDSRGSDKTVQCDQPVLEFGKSVQPLVSDTLLTTPPRPPKRRRQSGTAIASQIPATQPVVKRPRIDDDEVTFKKEVASASAVLGDAPRSASKMVDMERAKEVIEHEFNVAILLKHQEWRLINQELAKCQIALEQLRRCHLIPYPVNVPTPQQMLNVSNGQGPVLQAKTGEKVPQWAPPFGVVDGPYARHYAKWLIPDPKFDGIIPSMPTHGETSRFRSSMDSRSTRHGFGDLGKARPGRGYGQKLQALSSGYPTPKDKAGPCILKRAADGKTVKLVCVKCHRENFSSTQGFINHCRIAHKIEYKSHEEAAIACGHPIDVEEVKPTTTEDRSAPTPVANTPSTSIAPGLVHPFARQNAMSEAEACFSVVRRIEQSLEMYRRGELKGATLLPGLSDGSKELQTTSQRPSNFAPSTDSPNLSRLLQSRGKSMDLDELVRDAKTKVDLDEAFSSSDESEDEADSIPSSQVLAPRMRVPARTAMSPVLTAAGTRPASSKGRIPAAPYATPVPTPAPRILSDQDADLPLLDDDMDMDMSPNTAVSNNAPSLVSDDGEYDDSVDGSSDESDANDSIEADSVSDVAEIALDDDHVGPRALRHHRDSAGAGAGAAMRFTKDDSKHVTFMSPVKETTTIKQKRGRRIH